ncbi:MAG: hypothetical protein R8L53_01360 [Mariprofundales bacterium]
MVPIKRSQPAPACLAKEAQKVSGNYNCGYVENRINADSFSKCYICEEKYISNINIEHFIPHQGNKTLKFNWNNLLLSCCHCNNIKSNRYQPMLDCTNEKDQVDKAISYHITIYPRVEKVFIKPIKNSEKVNNTVSHYQ